MSSNAPLVRLSNTSWWPTIQFNSDTVYLESVKGVLWSLRLSPLQTSVTSSGPPSLLTNGCKSELPEAPSAGLIILYTTHRTSGRRFLCYCCFCCLITKSCLTLCNSLDCSKRDSSVHGILLARMLVQIQIQISRSVVSDSLRPHGLQHVRLPCPSPTPGAYSNSCPSHW